MLLCGWNYILSSRFLVYNSLVIELKLYSRIIVPRFTLLCFIAEEIYIFTSWLLGLHYHASLLTVENYILTSLSLGLYWLQKTEIQRYNVLLHSRFFSRSVGPCITPNQGTGLFGRKLVEHVRSWWEIELERSLWVFRSTWSNGCIY